MSVMAVRPGSTAIARTCAAMIALAAIVGIGLNATALLEQTGTIGSTLWVLLRYFTITTNLLVAVIFVALTLGAPVNVRLVGGTALCIALVGVIYDLFLQGLQELTAGQQVANILLHRVTPIVVVLYWLVFTPKGQLRWIEPLYWALYPLAYLVYGLVRGAAEGQYAYPFIDVARLGVAQVAINAVAITVAFLIVGALMVLLDRALGGRSARNA